MKHIHCLLLAAVMVSLPACSTWDKLNNTEKGAVIGAGSGAAIGGAAGGGTGALIGGAGGGLAGGFIGHEMDEDDREDRRRRAGRYDY